MDEASRRDLWYGSHGLGEGCGRWEVSLPELRRRWCGFNGLLSERNVWKVERRLIDYPHRPIGISDRRYRDLHERYQRYKALRPQAGLLRQPPRMDVRRVRPKAA